jgi:hypothetical protein
MRETLAAAAAKLLTEPVGTERTIIINTSDGLTGLPPGMHARQSRSRTVVVTIEEQTRPKDTKKRIAACEMLKGKKVVLAATTWT